MLFVNNFEYDGINSSRYGLFFGHINKNFCINICLARREFSQLSFYGKGYFVGVCAGEGLFPRVSYSEICDILTLI